MYKNICLIFVMLMTVSTVFAENTYNPEHYNKQKEPITLKDSVVTVPAGQGFHAVTMMPLNSANLTLGQNVTLAIVKDFYYNGILVAPAGSTVNGTVLEVSKAKHGTVNGKLIMRFTQIVNPYGIQIPISAVVKTEDNKGVLIGGEKMDLTIDNDKNKVNISTKVNKSVNYTNVATIGTTVGSGGGVIKGIWDKGVDVEIPIHTGIDLILTQPITVSPTVNQNNF